MKTRYTLSGLAISILLLASCYEDKGNYDYYELNQLTIHNIDQAYHKIALSDSLHIQPVIEFSQNSDYEYLWYVTHNEGDADTLGTKKELHCGVDFKPGIYDLLFRVMDKHSGVATYFTSQLHVITEYSNGWFVLREIDGITDLDLFTPDGKKMTDLMFKNNGKALKGKPISIGYSGKFTVDATSGTLKSTQTLIPMTDQDIQILRANDLLLLREFDDMFYQAPGKCAPHKFMQTSMSLYFMNNNQFYSITNMMANIGKFTEPYIDNFHFSPVMVQDAFYCYVYEEITGEILEESWGAMMTYQKGLSGKLIHGYSLNSWDLYFLFQKQEHPDSLYLVLPGQKLDTLPVNLNISRGTSLANNQEFNFIYYANGDQLGVLDVSGHSEKYIYDFKGEEITFIAHVKPTTGEVNHLLIATYKDENYKLYKFEMQAGIPRKDVDPEIMSGKGRCGYAFYMSDKYNNVNYKPNFY